MSNNLKDLEAMAIVVKEFINISKANRTILLNMLNKEHDQIGDVVDDPFYEVKKLYLEAGGRSNPRGLIPFIKEVRELSGKQIHTGYPKMGLKEAKDLVESW